MQSHTLKKALFVPVFMGLLFFTSCKGDVTEAHLADEEFMPASMEDMAAVSESLQTVLRNHVLKVGSTTKVDYEKLYDNEVAMAELYLQFYRDMDLNSMGAAQKLPALLNVYHAQLLLALHEKEKQEDVDGLDEDFLAMTELHTFQNRYSLKDLENLMWEQTNDPALMFVLNKGTTGSGSFPTELYTADNMERMMKFAAQNFINHRRGVAQQGQKVILSRLFEQYADKFQDPFPSLRAYIANYLQDDTLREAVLRYDGDFEYMYDDSINAL